MMFQVVFENGSMRLGFSESLVPLCDEFDYRILCPGGVFSGKCTLDEMRALRDGLDELILTRTTSEDICLNTCL